jgi:hypothetical protein
MNILAFMSPFSIEGESRWESTPEAPDSIEELLGIIVAMNDKRFHVSPYELDLIALLEVQFLHNARRKPHGQTVAPF